MRALSTMNEIGEKGLKCFGCHIGNQGERLWGSMHTLFSSSSSSSSSSPIEEEEQEGVVDEYSMHTFHSSDKLHCDEFLICIDSFFLSFFLSFLRIVRPRHVCVPKVTCLDGLHAFPIRNAHLATLPSWPSLTHSLFASVTG